MPSTSANLGLYKPNLGQNDVADELNANTETLDQRFGGTVGHTHAGTAGEGPKIPVTSIAASGSLGPTKFLRADGRWATAGGGGGGVTDHDELTGLADDDHTQYFNQSRGDARYTQRASNLSDLSSAATARTNLGAAAATHTHAAADIASGTIDTARLGSGTADATKVLRGDQTWADMLTVALELDDLGDVTITTPADNQVLTYDSASSTWKNEAAAGGGGAVATDAIWDAAGDLAVGSGANTAVKLAKGTALQRLRVNAAGTALEWFTPTTEISFMFTADGSAYYVTTDACSIAAGQEGGTGTLTYAIAPDNSATFGSTVTLPQSLAAGETLRVSVSALTTFKAVTLVKT